jgi:hypothetical protein
LRIIYVNAKLVATTVIGFLSLSSVAMGQRSVHLLVGGGVAAPLGRSDATYNTGASGFAGITWASQWSVLGARVDYSGNTFRGRTVNDTVFGKKTVPAITGDLVFSLPLSSLKPYVFGGPGLYPFRGESDTKTKTHLGVSGGAGFTFPFVFGSGFLEGKYHTVRGLSRRGEIDRFATATLGLVL